jgi:hypothetical protein
MVQNQYCNEYLLSLNFKTGDGYQYHCRCKLFGDVDARPYIDLSVHSEEKRSAPTQTIWQSSWKT